MRKSKSKFKICTHAPTNLEFKFVISDVLPYIFLLSTYAHDEKENRFLSREIHAKYFPSLLSCSKRKFQNPKRTIQNSK